MPLDQNPYEQADAYVISPSGLEQFYKRVGVAGRRLFLCILPCGTRKFFEGVVESLVRVERPSGVTEVYEGVRTRERLVRREDARGVIRLSGRRGQEKKVQFDDLVTGLRYVYKGSRGVERLVRIHDSKGGAVFFYKGDASEERLVRHETAEGLVVHYRGARSKEHVVRVVKVHMNEADPSLPSKVPTVFECSVCMDDDPSTASPHALSCGHCFCKDCAELAFVAHQCHTCRSRVTDRPIRLYL